MDKPIRCFFCKKKQMILVDCSCKRSFCLLHRMAEDHSCSFDYLKKGKDDIMKSNPKISSVKVEKV